MKKTDREALAIIRGYVNRHIVQNNTTVEKFAEQIGVRKEVVRYLVTGVYPIPQRAEVQKVIAGINLAGKTRVYIDELVIQLFPVGQVVSVSSSLKPEDRRLPHRERI